MTAVAEPLTFDPISSRFEAFSQLLPSPNGDSGEPGSPSPNGKNGHPKETNGRDARGRFAAGNKGGPGNPFARRVAGLRKLLLEMVPEEGLHLIVQRLVKEANTGNIQAARLVLAYVIGKPLYAPDPDRVDIEEWKLLLETGILPTQFKEVLQKMPADLACRLVQVSWPALIAAQAQPALRRAKRHDARERKSRGAKSNGKVRKSKTK